MKKPRFQFNSRAHALKAVKMLCDEASQMAGGSYPPEAICHEGEWSMEDQRRLIEQCRRALNHVVRSSIPAARKHGASSRRRPR